MRFYDETWTVTQKALSQVIVLIDVLKFLQERAGSLSASNWILCLRNMQYLRWYYGPLHHLVFIFEK